MEFHTLQIEKEYRSKHIDIIQKFYIPLLSRANKYSRAVGYFSSGILSGYAVGLKQLIDNGGVVQLVASPSLSAEDLDAIRAGYQRREEIIEKALLRSLQEPENRFEKECLNLLAHYIAIGKLDIRIAVVSSGEQSLGMYHEKFGIISNAEGEIVAFSGSNNETMSGAKYNYETLDVYCSWENQTDYERTQNKVSAFEKIWLNQDKDVEVYDFPKIEQEIVSKYNCSQDIPNIEKLVEEMEQERIEWEESRKKRQVAIPENVHLYDYQYEAIKEWEKRDFRGIFDMATGTGKTFTGIGALCRLYEVLDGKLAAIIVCPYQHLVDQWVEDLKVFGIRPIVGYSSAENRGYEKRLRDAIRNYHLNVTPFFCFICTQDTFQNETKVQSQLCKLQENVLLMVDEAHNIGAQKSLQYLREDLYTYRLALSATLDRYGDISGTQALYDFFGEKCIEYTLERAIYEDKLTRYYYYPLLVSLDDEEREEYLAISKELYKCLQFQQEDQNEMSEAAKRLAIKRARLVARARGKTDALFALIQDKQLQKKNHLLIYCGAASLQGDTQDDTIRQIDYVSRELWERFEMKTAQFTSNEDIEQRRIIRTEFAAGDDLQGIVAIKCLDEGVNIPEIETAFILASTTNPKEYIQRRGRVLRKCPGKRFAYIYDFVTIPRPLEDVTFLSDNELQFDKSLIRNELKRVVEFQRLAENKIDSYDVITTLANAYDLDIDF